MALLLIGFGFFSPKARKIEILSSYDNGLSNVRPDTPGRTDGYHEDLRLDFVELQPHE